MTGTCFTINVVQESWRYWQNSSITIIIIQGLQKVKHEFLQFKFFSFTIQKYIFYVIIFYNNVDLLYYKFINNVWIESNFLSWISSFNKFFIIPLWGCKFVSFTCRWREVVGLMELACPVYLLAVHDGPTCWCLLACFAKSLKFTRSTHKCEVLCYKDKEKNYIYPSTIAFGKIYANILTKSLSW